MGLCPALCHAEYIVRLPNHNELSTYFAGKYRAFPLHAIKQKGCKMCHSINSKLNSSQMSLEYRVIRISEGIKGNFHFYKGFEGHAVLPHTHTHLIGLNLICQLQYESPSLDLARPWW